jgi:hypothetical protein
MRGISPLVIATSSYVDMERVYERSHIK